MNIEILRRLFSLFFLNVQIKKYKNLFIATKLFKKTKTSWAWKVLAHRI